MQLPNVLIETLGTRLEDPLITAYGNLNMIDNVEIQHRDRVLETYFEGRDWDRNNEYALKRELVMKRAQLLPDYPFIFDDEWQADPNREQAGKGDLIFADGHGNFAVVEVKWINHEQRGSTGSTRRTQKRKKVKKQASKYRDLLAEKLGSDFRVEGFYFTNDDKTQVFPCNHPLP